MLDAVVVGAGIGGLSAAIALAARGLSVRVLEAHDRPGGKAGIVTIEGVEVDTGPSVLTLPDTFAPLLEAAGMRLGRDLALRTPRPAFRYLYPDGAVLDVHPDLDATLASVARALGSGPAAELEGFARYAATIWRSAAPAFVFGEAPRLSTLLSGMRALGRIDPLRSMQAAIAARVRSPHLRMLLYRYATYNGSDVRTAPATLNCIAHVELALGGFGVEGGMYELVRALVRAAERLGVVIECGARVEEILTDEAGVRGITYAGGRSLAARAVVANCEPAHLRDELLPERARRALPAEATGSMSGFNLVMKARRRERVAHTVLFPREYLDEFADIFDRRRPPREPTAYLCAQEACHGRRGWPAHEPVFAMANAPPLDAEGQEDDALERRLRARLEAAGLFEASDEVVWRRGVRDLAARFPGSRGSIYGPASNGMRAAFRRAPNRLALRGLYLASGSAHPGGGLPLAALSGLAAARALLTDRQQGAER